MVEENKQMRNMLRKLKDKTSLIKKALSLKGLDIHVAVIQATSHSPSPPSAHRVGAVLSLGRHSASACVAAVMDRLHKTGDAYVALKCLFMIHRIIIDGSFVIKDQLLLLCVSSGGSSLNLSTFRDRHARELSEWVRWYASVLEHNLMASKVLGTYFSSPATKSNKDNLIQIKSTPMSNSDVLKETNALVSMVVQISRTPESLQCQRNNLVYEIVNLVGEDYRSTQQHISVRLSEFWEKIDELSIEETADLVSCLERLEECRENLKKVFVNRKRNNEFWDFIGDMKVKAVKAAEEKMRWLVVRRVEVGKVQKDSYIPLLLF